MGKICKEGEGRLNPEVNLFNWIANQGFAIAVAAYLLIRIESKLETLIKKVEELCVKLDKPDLHGDPFGG